LLLCSEKDVLLLEQKVIKNALLLKNFIDKNGNNDTNQYTPFYNSLYDLFYKLLVGYPQFDYVSNICSNVVVDINKINFFCNTHKKDELISFAKEETNYHGE